MLNLFIDTNSLLGLYGLSTDRLKELEKLVEMAKSGEVVLYLPEQVKNEFFRNREGYVLKNLEELEDYSQKRKDASDKLPQVPEKIPEIGNKASKISELSKVIRESNNAIDKIVAEAQLEFKNNAMKNSFPADKLITMLFSVAKFIPYDAEVVVKAKTRFDLGNPPGKRGSYGDAVVWETLLKEVPNEQDLHFVGFDGDYKSKIDKSAFSPFLNNEWATKKKSKIILYEHIGEFTKKYVPKVNSDKVIEQENKFRVSIFQPFDYSKLFPTMDFVKKITEDNQKMISSMAEIAKSNLYASLALPYVPPWGVKPKTKPENENKDKSENDEKK